MSIEDRLLESRQQLAIQELGKSKDKRLRFYTLEDTQKYTTRELCTATAIYHDPVPYLELIPDTEVVGIDVETTGFDCKVNRIICLGVSSKSCQYIIWGKYSAIAEALTWLEANRVLCAHNFKFDGKFIRYQLGLEINVTYDTMIMQHLANSALSKDLASCAERYLNRTPLHFVELVRPHNPKGTKDKDLDINLVPIQELANYCAEDCLESALLVPHYLKELTQPQQVLHDIEIGCQQLLIHTELTGISYDVQRARKLEKEYTDLIEIIEGEIYNLAGCTFNLGSTQQLSKVLFEDLGLPTEGVSRGKTGSYSVSKEVISRLDQYPICRLLLEYRQVQKLIKDFCVKLANMAEANQNIIHASFNQVGTITGRLSCSEPNLQQIPNPNKSVLGRQIRSLFIARPGKVLVKADFSQFELRIIAHLSEENYLIQAFRQDLDVHALVTELIFGITYDKDNPTHKRYRTLTKTLNFGLAYGMTPIRLSSESFKVGLNYDIEKCTDIFNQYWRVLPGVAKFFATTKVKTIVKGYSETLMGRRRYFNFTHPYLNSLSGKERILSQNPVHFLEHLESKGVVKFDDAGSLRECTNHAIQGTNADVIKLIMYQWYNQEFYLEAPILLNVHDEIVIEVEESSACFWSDVLRHTMENSIKLSVPIKVEPSVGLYWSSPE